MPDILTIDDPRGKKVILSEVLWEKHILEEHPGMKQLLREIGLSITHPYLGAIYSDTGSKKRNVYYYRLRRRDLYVKVVVEFNSESNGEIKTAFLTDSPKKGEKIIWPPSGD